MPHKTVPSTPAKTNKRPRQTLSNLIVGEVFGSPEATTPGNVGPVRQKRRVTEGAIVPISCAELAPLPRAGQKPKSTTALPQELSGAVALPDANVFDPLAPLLRLVGNRVVVQEKEIEELTAELERQDALIFELRQRIIEVQRKESRLLFARAGAAAARRDGDAL